MNKKYLIYFSYIIIFIVIINILYLGIIKYSWKGIGKNTQLLLILLINLACIIIALLLIICCINLKCNLELYLNKKCKKCNKIQQCNNCVNNLQDYYNQFTINGNVNNGAVYAKYNTSGLGWIL
jgi:hypothetical protein